MVAVALHHGHAVRPEVAELLAVGLRLARLRLGRFLRVGPLLTGLRLAARLWLAGLLTVGLLLARFGLARPMRTLALLLLLPVLENPPNGIAGLCVGVDPLAGLSGLSARRSLIRVGRARFALAAALPRLRASALLAGLLLISTARFGGLVRLIRLLGIGTAGLRVGALGSIALRWLICFFGLLAFRLFGRRLRRIALGRPVFVGLSPGRRVLTILRGLPRFLLGPFRRFGLRLAVRRLNDRDPPLGGGRPAGIGLLVIFGLGPVADTVSHLQPRRLRIGRSVGELRPSHVEEVLPHKFVPIHLVQQGRDHQVSPVALRAE